GRQSWVPKRRPGSDFFAGLLPHIQNDLSTARTPGPYLSQSTIFMVFGCAAPMITSLCFAKIFRPVMRPRRKLVTSKATLHFAGGSCIRSTDTVMVHRIDCDLQSRR